MKSWMIMASTTSEGQFLPAWREMMLEKKDRWKSCDWAAWMFENLSIHTCIYPRTVVKRIKFVVTSIVASSVFDYFPGWTCCGGMVTPWKVGIGSPRQLAPLVLRSCALVWASLKLNFVNSCFVTRICMSHCELFVVCMSHCELSLLCPFILGNERAAISQSRAASASSGWGNSGGSFGWGNSWRRRYQKWRADEMKLNWRN